MIQYHRKIRIDYNKYFIKYSDGDTTRIVRSEIRKKLSDGGGDVVVSGITGPSINMVVCLNQKIKDLGIYNDTLI